jgi:hypothetical protein
VEPQAKVTLAPAHHDAAERRLADVVAEDEWGIVPPPSTGELFFLARYSKAFLDLYGGRRVIAFVQRGHIPLLRLFPDAPIAGLDRSQFDIFVLEYGVQQGRILKLSYGKHATNKTQGVLRDRDVRTGFARLFLEEVRIPLSTSAIEPRVTDAVREAGWRRFRAAGLKEGRTVILAPIAYSCQSASPSAWRKIATVLKQRGFSVATTCGPNEAPVEGTVPFQVDFDELYVGVELGGVLISARSGLCDVCSGNAGALHIVMRDTVLVVGPGVIVLPQLEASGLRDRAVYHFQKRDEGGETFADRLLAHPDLT